MRQILTAVRALFYMTAFLSLWAWLAVWARRLGAAWDTLLPPGSVAAGVALIVLGATLGGWCVALFIVEGRGTPAPFDAPRAFVPSGPYRWVRNPMYVGGALLLLGLGLSQRSLVMALFTIPAVLVAHLFVVSYEEPTLESRFGKPYADYRRHVPRWLPRLPRGERRQKA